jgi:hypothetical protein
VAETLLHLNEMARQRARLDRGAGMSLH